MPPMPPVTRALLMVLTGVFCVDLLLPMLRLSHWFGLWPLGSGLFMPWQVLSYALLHADMMHLFFNALGLWMFGAELERLWGQKRFVQFLLASVLAAAACQLLISLLTGGFRPTVGISGGLYGLLLASAMLFPNRTIMPLFPPIPMKQRTFVMVFGGLELFQGLSGFSGVAHFAYLGGMLGGWLMIRYWRGQAPFSGKRRW